MLALLSFRRKAMGWLTAAFAGLTLAACDMQFPASGPVLNANAPVNVALLLPKTAANGASVAQSLENAARLAVTDLGNTRVTLKVYDTAGTPQGAQAAAQRALADGSKIFLGPLFAENANAVGQIAAGRGVNVMTFSNNPSVAGGNVFLLGNTFQNSADRLVRYAVRQGKGNIYVIHADDPAERLAAEAIQRAAGTNGGSIAGMQSFALSQQGVIDAIPGIASNYRASGANTVFVTSGTSGALPFLADLLPENGIDRANAQFIGLQRLDIPSSALSLKGLQGAWYATPSPALAQQFNNRYASVYGSQPNPIAGLAYDGVAAIGALLAQGGSDPLGTQALTQGAGFAGVSGPFRFFRNGTNQRGLAIAQIENNKVTVIDPAPRSFGGAGF
ncbi:MAG: penicillin-binding protein activator [Silicimonas sp.]|nr:penicillin-binding protein activator [Silicimonas sp.]